jgi:hypothetical protein
MESNKFRNQNTINSLNSDNIMNSTSIFLASAKYKEICKKTLQNTSSDTKINISKHYGYHVKNKLNTVDMAPKLTSNIDDAIDYEG